MLKLCFHSVYVQNSRPFFAICERFSEKTGDGNTATENAGNNIGARLKRIVLQSTKFLLNLENHCRNEGVTV